MDDYLTAIDAAALLGVTVDTLYVYVSRKGIRSIPISDSSKRLYWRPDVERARRRGGKMRGVAGEPESKSAIILYTSEDLFYRGHSVRKLSETATLEEVAALLWDVEEGEVFTERLPAAPASLDGLMQALQAEDTVTKARALFPVLEDANPRFYDLSKLGIARTGADVLRWLCALTLGRCRPAATPIHATFAAALGLSAENADLARCLLVLSADHGLEAATFAVRAVAGTGVSPWRFVPTGLSVMNGRHGSLGHFGRVERLVAEIVGSDNPAEPVTRRVREGAPVPGFQSLESSQADARVRILQARLQATMGSDPDFQRIEAASSVVHDIQGLEPTFGYLGAFVWRRLGLHRHEVPFLLGRSIGWIAHGIEEQQAGERVRGKLHYSGPLPTTRWSGD